MRRKRKIVEKREGERQGGHEDSRRERVVEEKDGGTKCEKKGEKVAGGNKETVWLLM